MNTDFRSRMGPVAAKAKKIALGAQTTDGLLFKLFIYVLVVALGFVFLFPVLRMLSSSMKTIQDLLDPIVGFMPTSFYLENYTKAIRALRLVTTLPQSFIVAGVPALCQTAAAMFIGYGFARFRFPLKRMWFVIMIASFVIPTQVTMIPRYLTFANLGMLGSLSAIAVPAALGQGLDSAIFILLFYQFFSMIPPSLEESAQLDGANRVIVLIRISIPLVVPAIIITSLFSFVWYWNETYITGLYLEGRLTTMPLELSRFEASFNRSVQDEVLDSERMINEGIRLAATLLTIVPVTGVFLVLQRWFIEGIEKSGITGE